MYVYILMYGLAALCNEFEFMANKIYHSGATVIARTNKRVN